jgi:hypothetical protein
MLISSASRLSILQGQTGGSPGSSQSPAVRAAPFYTMVEHLETSFIAFDEIASELFPSLLLCEG